MEMEMGILEMKQMKNILRPFSNFLFYLIFFSHL